MSTWLPSNAVEPRTVAEFALLADAFDEIHRRRLVENGLTDSEASDINGIVSDWFAFEAVVRSSGDRSE